MDVGYSATMRSNIPKRLPISMPKRRGHEMKGYPIPRTVASLGHKETDVFFKTSVDPCYFKRYPPTVRQIVHNRHRLITGQTHQERPQSSSGRVEKVDSAERDSGETESLLRDVSEQVSNDEYLFITLYKYDE
jgi:hypothetical protein